MAAITGMYIPPEKRFRELAVKMLDRTQVASVMRHLKDKYGAHEAREFANYMLWMNTYPVYGNWKRPINKG